MAIEKILLIALVAGVFTALGTYTVESMDGLGKVTSGYDTKLRALASTGP